MLKRLLGYASAFRAGALQLATAIAVAALIYLGVTAAFPASLAPNAISCELQVESDGGRVWAVTHFTNSADRRSPILRTAVVENGVLSGPLFNVSRDGKSVKYEGGLGSRGV